MQQLREHALRRSVVNEMHLRRWPEVLIPGLVVQTLRIVSPEERGEERSHLAALPDRWTIDQTYNPKHASAIGPDELALAWEQHTEASALTIVAALGSLDVVDSDNFNRVMSWQLALPGEVVRATRIFVVNTDQEAEPLLDRLDFAKTDLVSCHLGDHVRIWSDFRIAEDGFGRLLIAANGLNPSDFGRLLQKFQELGNYRNLALLGLPAATARWEDLNRLEKGLAALAVDAVDPSFADDELLERVTAISAELMVISTSTSYRMKATAAYGRLAQERLSEIQPRAISGHQSLTEFTTRRLLPAIRTCDAHSARDADLSTKAAQFAALLRARIETRIEKQNAQLLESMDNSATMQVRLQLLVEGFSVIAISYYVLGLLTYMAKGVADGDAHRYIAILFSIGTPVIVLSLWLYLHRVKRRTIVNDKLDRMHAGSSAAISR